MATHRRRLPLKTEGMPAGDLWFDWDDQTGEITLLHPEIVILDANLVEAISSYYGELPLPPIVMHSAPAGH